MEPLKSHYELTGKLCPAIEILKMNSEGEFVYYRTTRWHKRLKFAIQSISENYGIPKEKLKARFVNGS